MLLFIAVGPVTKRLPFREANAFFDTAVAIVPSGMFGTETSTGPLHLVQSIPTRLVDIAVEGPIMAHVRAKLWWTALLSLPRTATHFENERLFIVFVANLHAEPPRRILRLLTKTRGRRAALMVVTMTRVVKWLLSMMA